MSNNTFLYSTPNPEKPLYGQCPEQGKLLMAATSIPVFWYMLFEEKSLVLGPEHDNPQQQYLHMTTAKEEGLTRAESRWLAVRGVLGGSIGALFRTWLSFVRETADAYIHCETIEWFWMFDTHAEFEAELRLCLAAFDHVPLRTRRVLELNKWWNNLLGQAGVDQTNSDLRPLGNLSYCGFSYHFDVPWDEDDYHFCGALKKELQEVPAFGDKPEDILGHMEKFGGNDEFRVAKCDCGSDTFGLRYMDMGAERTCTRCGTKHLLCDSADYWYEPENPEPDVWHCKDCNSSTANLGVGFVFNGTGGVKLICLGQRCVKCGRLDYCLAWETRGNVNLIEQV